ncbi:MAG: glycosyltransferase [Ignavibacteria bacterium]|jgi:GT2 family glycosyltransferase/MoaA/NifB/PqqE/SkfB family radical SAM enzyme/2-polyprenyl-3-methyl-5-hydroxy-6-metoxy-1,4-benzoquinol methylase
MNNKINNPLVSINCITYNHEKFISNAIEGFLLQKTNFPFEVLMGEDCSSDNTLNIIKAYQEKYPDVIKIITSENNVGTFENGKRLIEASRGEYISFCEGDDYWIDPLKLQKQVDFLEKNSQYVLCYHNASIVDENDVIISKSKLRDDFKSDYSQEELIQGKMVLTLTLLARNVVKEFPHEFLKVKNGDKFLTSLYGNFGRGKYLDNIKNAVYRKHSLSIWSKLDQTTQIFHNGNTRAWLSRYYKRINKSEYADYFRNEVVNHFYDVIDNVLLDEISDYSNLIKKIFNEYNDLIYPNEIEKLSKQLIHNKKYSILFDPKSKVLQNNFNEKESVHCKNMQILRTGDWELMELQELNVDWILTRKCNYQCNYCTVHDNKNGFFVPLEKIKKVVDKIRELPNKNIIISFSGGEPTLHPKFFEINEYVFEKLGDRVKIVIQTNLSKPVKFYEKFIERFRDKLNLFKFYTSYHFEYAKKDNFINRLKLLSKNGVYVVFKICAEPNFMDEVKQVYSEALKIKNEKLDVALVVVRQDYGSVPDKRYKPENLEWLEENYVEENHKSILLEYQDTESGKLIDSQKYLADNLIINKQNNFKGLVCHAGLNLMSINGDGTLDRSVCFRKVRTEKPNVYDNPDSILDFQYPIRCPFDSCYVPTDLKLPKYNFNVLQNLIAGKDDASKIITDSVKKFFDIYSFDEVNSAIENKELTKARRTIEFLLQIDPNNVGISILLTKLLIAENKKLEAVTAVNRVLELDPGNNTAFKLFAGIKKELVPQNEKEKLITEEQQEQAKNIKEITERKYVRVGSKNKFTDSDNLEVNWVLTRKCNYQCSYCTVYNNKGSFIPLDLLKRAVDRLAELDKSRYTIILTGGEPTIHPDYQDLLLYIFEKLGEKVTVITISNLGRTNKYFSDFAEKMNGYENQIRFVASYHFDFANKDKFLENINTLSSKGFYTKIQIMAHPEKMNEVRYLDKELGKIKNEYVEYRVMVIRENYGTVPDKRYNQEDLKWIQNYYNNQTEEQNILIETINKYGQIKTDYYSEPEINSKGLNKYKGMICNAGVSNMSINEFGSVDRAVCFRGTNVKSKNIYNDDNPLEGFENAVVCPFERCGCTADIAIPKFSPDYNKISINNNDLRKRLEKVNWSIKYEKYAEVFEYNKIFNNVANPKISVIVISWRLHPDNLKNFEILQKQRNQNYELIFVNNGADKKEFECLEPFIDTYIKLNKNTGAYLARNIGSVFAKSDILFFLEDDGIPFENIVEAHLTIHELYDVIAVRGVYIPKTENKFNEYTSHYYLGNKPFPMYADLEGNTTYKAKHFFEVGGWDDQIRFGGGGVDLSIRLNKIEPDKRKQIYSPDPVIYHDYAKDEKHLQHKIDKQKKSRERLKDIHPNWDEYLASWHKLREDEFSLIKKEIEEEKQKSKNLSPFISICIPTYNRSKFILETLKSALDQKYDNFEVVVVDDGSTDNTKEIIKSINDPKLRFIEKEHTNAPDTRNRCIAEAKGDYILWLDSDDEFYPDILNEYVAVLNKYKDVQIVYCNLKTVDVNEKLLRVFKYPDYYNKLYDAYTFLFTGQPIPNAGTLLKKSIYSEIGNFNTDFKRAHDFEFYSRLFSLKKYNLKHVNKFLYKYKIHEDNITFNTSGQLDTSYEVKIFESIFSKSNYRDFFPNLNWQNDPQNSSAIAYLNIGIKFYQLKGFRLSEKYFEKFLLIDNSNNNFVELFNKLFNDDQYELASLLLSKVEQKVSGYGSFNDVKRIITQAGYQINNSSNISSKGPVDIIFLTYNRLKYFQKTLESLKNNTRYPHRIIVVDNASENKMVNYLKENELSFHKVIYNKSNEWTAAFQKGIGVSTSDPFIVCDPDILVPNIEGKCWLERLIELHEKNEDMGLIALNLDPSNKPEKMPDVYISDKTKYNDDITLSNVGTVMQAIKRKYFNFSYNTDWETCEKIRQNGGKVGFANNIIAYHLGWNEGKDYPDYMVDKFKYFKNNYGVDTYKMYTQNSDILKAMDSSVEQYYEYNRPEVQKLVNPNSKKILDVGCGSGVMAFELKEKLNAEVWGIEPVEKAAKKAETKLDKVISGSIESALDKLPDNYFDSIIFADVLEHLVDPKEIIESIKLKLKSKGEIVTSIPNVRHWTMIKKLIEGDWRYEDAGILDKTHLRFFTIDTAIELFSKCGFNVEELSATFSEKYQYPDELLTTLNKFGYNVSTLQEHSQYYQYLLKSVLKEVEIETSIVIPVYNQLEHTETTINFIYETVKGSFELIIINNNSKQDISDYLNNLSVDRDNVKVITNNENLGFPKAVNQGLMEAKGKYIVVANNDIIVNKGWLERFIEAAESSDSIGIVSGISNEVSGVQKDLNAAYKSIEEMQKYAEMVKLQNAGKKMEFPRVAFLCTLIKKEVIDKIGGLDERFSPGNYEDDDYCLRSQVAGYKTVVCKDVFIHHFGSRSFKANGNDKYDSLLNINRQKFIDKWGNDPDNIWLKGKSINLREVEYPIDQNEIHRFVKRANYNINSNEYDLALINLKKCIVSFNKQNKIEEGELKLSSILNLAGKVTLKLGKQNEAEDYFSMAKKIENNIFRNDDCILKLDEIENELLKENEISNFVEKKS